MPKKRILILTSDAGFGHRSAANAIDDALDEVYGSQCETKIVNPTDQENTPDIIQQLEQGYDDMVVDSPELYRLSYHIMDAPLISDLVKAAVDRMFTDTMFAIIQEFRPQVIVSTYPLHAGAAARVLQDLKIDCPLAVVITDLTDVQSLWYSPEATMHFVPTAAIRQQAYENNIPATRVRVTGIPVNPAITKEIRRPSEIRADLGWQQDLPTCLIVASPRTSEMEQVSRMLRRIPDLQVAVVCGGNSHLYKQLKSIADQEQFHLLDWVDNMPQLMKASDFIVSKAGGLIVSESLACGRPLILAEALPGQEIGNMHYVVNNQAGAWAPGPMEVTSTILSILREGSTKIQELQKNARELGKPQAAFDVAKSIWGLIQGQRAK